MNSSYYDDSRLYALFDALSPQNRKKALKGALRSMAKKMRKNIVQELRATGIHTTPDLERGVRSMLLRRDVAGFRVTVGERRGSSNGRTKARGYYISRHAKPGSKGRPILRWLDTGTTSRTTKRSKRSTGSIRPGSFVDKGVNRTKPTLTNDTRQAIFDYILKTSQKYGCK
jgi:hypothetical protein